MKNWQKGGFIGLILAGIVTVVMVVFLPYRTPPAILPHSRINQLTGKNAINDSTPYDVMGTDLGIVAKYQGQFRYIFGDTFGGDFTYWGNPNGNKDTHWRSNVMAYSTDTDASDGITIDGWINNTVTSQAKELISSQKDDIEVTCIPTTTFTDGVNFYIYYMSVSNWGDPGKWDCNNASIAVSTDGANFTKIPGVKWDGGSNQNMFGVVQNTSRGGLSADDVYLLATPSGRFGNAYCLKVAKSQILNQAAYRYFTGTTSDGAPTWGSNPSFAQAVIQSPIGELSAMWNEYLKKFVVMYLEPNWAMIVLSTADHPWGPWSYPVGIVDSKECPGLYGGFLHPDFVKNNGQEICFIMSLWGDYNTFVMKADLVSLHASLQQDTDNILLFPAVILIAGEFPINRKRYFYAIK